MTAPPPQTKQEKKKAPGKEAAKRPLNIRGALIDDPCTSTSSSSSSTSPSPPLESPSPPLQAFTGFADPIIANVDHMPSPPDGSVQSTLKLRRAYKWVVASIRQQEEDSDFEEDHLDTDLEEE